MRYPQITGNVYGVVLNDRQSMQLIAKDLNSPPYHAPPKTPVLYVKPSNTWAQGADVFSTHIPNGCFEIGATIGVTFQKIVRQASPEHIEDCIAGWFLAVDICLPHTSYYRPAIRERCQDGSLIFGRLHTGGSLASLDPLELTTIVGLEPKTTTRTMSDWVRRPADLIAELSQFMRLEPGDAVLLGVPYGAMTATIGDRVSVQISAGDSLSFDIRQGV